MHCDYDTQDWWVEWQWQWEYRLHWRQRGQWKYFWQELCSEKRQKQQQNQWPLGATWGLTQMDAGWVTGARTREWGVALTQWAVVSRLPLCCMFFPSFLHFLCICLLHLLMFLFLLVPGPNGQGWVCCCCRAPILENPISKSSGLSYVEPSLLCFSAFLALLICWQKK